jgi:hypothetical protein
VLGVESDRLIEKLQGAKLIADFEAGYDRSDAAARQCVLELSERYGLASSEMSLVAVVERAGDQPGDVPKTKLVPVGMAQDTRFGSYFGNKQVVHAEYSMGPSMALFDMADDGMSEFLASRRMAPSRTVIVIEPLLREVIRVIEDYVLSGKSKDANRYIGTLLSILTLVENRLTNEAHKHTLKTLIDYLANDLDRARWATLREQLADAWPLLGAVVSSGTTNQSTSEDSLATDEIRGGMPLREALRVFEESVNQPGAIFSTDHWLAPKLEQLRGLLSDPITDDQATALVDVLHERHWMRDLIDWLQGPPMPWQSFFVLPTYIEPPFDPGDEISRLDF